MNITVFGGTGVTGLLLIKKALESGYTVTAYVRTPSKISIQHSKLKIVEGELTELDKLEEVINNADVVISTLGPTRETKDLALADGVKNITEAMKNKGVKRLIAITTTSFKDGNDKFQLGFSLGVSMVKLFFRHSYDNVVLIGKHISESNLDWTLVRIPTLSNKPASGKINAGYTGDGTIKVLWLTRADLADFLLQQMDDKKWLRKAPAISN